MPIFCVGKLNKCIFKFKFLLVTVSGFVISPVSFTDHAISYSEAGSESKSPQK